MRHSAIAIAIFSVLSTAQPAYANDTSTESDIETIEVTGRAQQFYLDSSTRVGTKTDNS